MSEINLDDIFSDILPPEAEGEEEIEEEASAPVDVRGLALKMKSKKRYMFKLSRETR